MQIADALRYYYWSIILLKSHPYSGSIYYLANDGDKKLLVSWLPTAINNIFSKITFNVNYTEEEENLKRVILDIKYDNQPVSNFDYSYWDGANWSNITSAKDGKGFMDFYGVSMDIKKAKVKAEYLFKGEAQIDSELKEVMAKVKHIPFMKSYFNFPIAKTTEKKEEVKKEVPKSTDNITEVKTTKQHQELLNKVLQAIKTKQYSSVKNLFTDDGYDTYTKLLSYGNARIIDKSNLRYLKYNNEVFIRSVAMSFSFKNNKNFVEDVNFTIDKDMKISNLYFALSDKASKNILGKTKWSEKNKLTIIYFLENYKTAYALKRLDYIESIFDDNALIIVGRVIKIKQTAENKYKNNTIIKNNTYTKKEYLKKLNYSFKSKQFINLKFEESTIRTTGKESNVFGIQIKQNYYSSNYGDVGYLFLMVNLSNPNEPIIHVRTWQPEKNADGSIYGIGDFGQ